MHCLRTWTASDVWTCLQQPTPGIVITRSPTFLQRLHYSRTPGPPARSQVQGLINVWTINISSTSHHQDAQMSETENFHWNEGLISTKPNCTIFQKTSSHSVPWDPEISNGNAFRRYPIRILITTSAIKRVCWDFYRSSVSNQFTHTLPTFSVIQLLDDDPCVGKTVWVDVTTSKPTYSPRFIVAVILSHSCN